MSLYQRYLSKSLIFIFSLFFLILFFLESSIGFKYFFNFTNYFFIGLKTEEISGNWRDFKLKKINFNIFGTSIKAESVHIITDPISLFKVSTILKKIKTKNLVISFNKKIKKVALKNNFLKEKKIKNTIFFKHSLILRKIYSDKILLKTQKKNIFLFGVFSGLQLSNDTCTFLPTKINSIYIDSSMRNVKNIDNKKSNFFIKKDIFYRNKIDNALSFFSIFKNFFIPININLINLKCNQLKFFNRTFLDIYKIKMSAQLKKNILKIKKIQIYSKYFKTKSKGKIFFRSDFSIFFIVKNEMSINIINNKAMNLLFKDTIDHKLNFKSNNLIKFNIHGEISLDDLNYPIHINLHLNRLFLPISKNLILSSKNFNFSLKGKINNYFLSLKNIINISGMPSFFISISAIGNIQNVVIKKIHFFPFFKEIKTKKFIKIKKEIDYNKYITQLAGKMRILSDFNKQSSNIFLPYFHVYGDFMRKKISVLGSLYYRKLNGITIPRINFLLGKNKGHISGSISKKVNLRSSIYANNLNYFSPNLKGVIKATLNIYSFCSLPSFSSVILGQKINWKNILYFNNIKITTNGNLKKSFPNKFFADFKNIRFSKFHINSLHIKSDWNNINQKFSLSLKDKKLSITFILNGHLNRKVGIWKGVLKKIDVKTSWGQWISRNNPLIFYHIKNSINFKNIKKIKNKNAFYSAINNIQTSLFKLIRQSPVKFQTDLFFNTQFQWKLRENITNLKLFLKGSNINLEKKIKEKIMFEKISAVNLYINFKKNNFITKWIIKKSKNSLKVNKISGFLNIYDFFHEKKIEGKVFLSDFSCSFLNFFENFFTKIQGKFSGNINFLGTIYQPQISADINFQDFYIKSDKIFKYMLLFFCSFPNKIENIKINQEIIMKKGNALFKLNSVVKNNISHIKWNILFHSNKLAIVLFPKIKLNFSSQLNLYYFLSKYDLIGYLKFSFFSFKINEKNFLF